VLRADAILWLLLLFLPIAKSAEPYSALWMREAKRHTRQSSVWKPLVRRMKISLAMALSASPDAVMATDGLSVVVMCIAPEMLQPLRRQMSISSVLTVRLTSDLSKIPYNPLLTKINDEKSSLH
jgi:hypothetical protein